MLIKIHSFIELITNSSTEIFTLSEESEHMVRDILKKEAERNGDLDWFNEEVTVSTNEDGTIEIYSFLNDPEWFRDFVKNTFNVI
jgi:hypothetical protein